MGLGDSLNLGVSDAVQAVKSAAGIVSSTRNTTKGQADLAWAGLAPPAISTASVKSTFFPSINIAPDRWDQLFPYRLMVIDVTTNKLVSKGGGKLTYSISQTPGQGGTGSAIINFENSSGWMIQLPISPQQLSIQDQYAINTSATLRGVLEEHNGVKFKIINAAGSMGVWPYRESLTKPAGTPGILQSLFGGTINALGSVISSVTSVINTATGGSPANKPTSLTPEVSTFGSQSTGYYQAMKLQQFLEQYAEAKLNPANASWRLVFDIPKQNQSLVVTPMQFTWQQNANKPMEIMFNFQLKAWRRVNLNQSTSSTPANNQPISPGILQRILNTLTEARTVMSAATNLIGAVRSDVEAPLNVLRQTSLLVKDLVGVAITAADLPSQVVQDYSSSIAASMAILSNTISSNITDPAARSSLNSVVANQNQVEGLSQAAVANGQLGSQAAINQTLNPANAVFQNPDQNFILLDQVPVSSLALNNAQQAVVQAVVAAASITSVDTLKQYRATIQQLALQLSNSFGTGDAFYSKVYSQPAPTLRIQPITLDEYDILKSLYDVMQSYDILTATTQIDDNNKQTNMDYVAGLADLAGIPFSVSTSKILAPVPFGMTIEGIAMRYLGDPQRWLEIVTLNNLRDPYIDENGFQYPLLSNATGRQITVGSNVDLYIGQRVQILGAGQTPSTRTILGIDRLSDTSFLITLDGLPNLDNFTISALSQLQAYLPGTVNSQQKIFIPSDLPVPDDSSIIPPPGTVNDPLTGLSKVDWLLTDSGDLAVNNFGDFRYSSGITNVMQALKIKFGTKSGTVLLHPTFGLGVKVGVISSELQMNEIYNSINEMIQQDPRFQGVSNLQVILSGPTLTINMGVNIAGIQGVFPVTFSLAA